MICLRCGKCCHLLDIFIVNPEAILPDGSLDTEDLWAMIPKPAGERCPHFSCESDLGVCTIHHLPCYQGTPCQQFEQFGPTDAACVMRGYFEIYGR